MGMRADRRYLLEHAYADPAGLTARLSLYDFQQPRIDLVAEVLAFAGAVDGQAVGDFGCGDGRYVAAFTGAGAAVAAIDLSIGMLGAIATPGPRAVGDVQALPLRDASLDVALMLHMLYHVPAPELAVAEAARVLRAGGRVVVATNGRRHLAEMDELWRPLLAELGVQGALEDVGLVNSRFDGDAARALLGRQCASVEERWLHAEVVLTDPGPVLRHAASTTGAVMAGAPRDELLRRFGDEVDARIRREGAFRITTEVVLMRASLRARGREAVAALPTAADET